MPIDIAAKLSRCRKYSDARPILETLGASTSAHELMQLYFAQPDNSPYKTRFLDTVVREMEDEDHKGGPHEKGNITENEENGKNGEKPTQEYELTGEGTAKSSSGPDLSKIGTEKGPTGDENAKPTENQMKEQLPGMPPGMAGMPPEIAQQMEQAMAAAPPMNPMQQMRYTQETIKGIVGTIYKDIAGIKEAITKLDTKVQETQLKSVPLEIPGGEKVVIPRGIQEIAADGGQPWGHGVQPGPPRNDIESKRQQIVEKDTLLTLKKSGKDVSQMYQ